MFNISNSNNPSGKPLIQYLETHIVDHCNLKCNHCSHFCHLIDEEIYTDINQFTKDINELSSKLDVFQLRLLGGEPLLHPQINNFMIEARKAFPASFISIVTNGILLPSMPQSFWDTVKENRIKIDLSKYPIIGNKFSEILDLIDDHDMQPGNIKLAKKFFESLNPKGDSDIEKSYKICGSKACVNLWKQHLYPCQNCYRYYYNKKFNTNLELPPAIDLYKLSGKEIFEELKKYKKPFSACKFCLEKGIVREWELYKE